MTKVGRKLPDGAQTGRGGARSRLQCRRGTRLGPGYGGRGVSQDPAVRCTPPREGMGPLPTDHVGQCEKALTLILGEEGSGRSHREVSQAVPAGEEEGSAQHLGAGPVLSARPCCHKDWAGTLGYRPWCCVSDINTTPAPAEPLCGCLRRTTIVIVSEHGQNVGTVQAIRTSSAPSCPSRVAAASTQ